MKKITFLALVLALVLLLSIGNTFLTSTASAAAKDDLSLWELFEKEIEPRRFVDLTNTFAPGIPRWSGFPSSSRKVLYSHDKDGFLAEEFTHVGQYGTHCDPPVHFFKGMRSLDQIPVKEMIMPLVVIDCSEKVKANPDYELTVLDIKAWEAKHGRIPAGAFVAMRSDWHKRFGDIKAFYNEDASGQKHYPGWSLESLKFLYEKRGINANGHEPPDTDAALAQVKTGFAAEAYVLQSNHFQIELMANLDKVPETGALLVCTWPKPKDGSGFPARLFAILP